MPSAASAIVGVWLTLAGTSAPPQDTTGVGAISGVVMNAAGRPADANRRNFASYSWNRRSNSQQFGEQQGLFPIIGLDWRF